MSDVVKNSGNDESKTNDYDHDDLNTHKFKVYYPKLKNRGNYVRMILVEAGIEFEDIMDDDIINSKCRCFNMMNKHNRRFDVFAPPFIEHNGHIIGQTVAIQQYIAQITGLRPKSAIDNALCGMILENANDTLEEMIKRNDDTFEQLSEYLNGRFQTWMDIFTKPLSYDKGLKYYFEDRVTVADIAVCNMIDGFRELFGQTKYKEIIADTQPLLDQHYQRIANRKAIKALLDKQNKEGITWYFESGFANVMKNVQNIKIVNDPKAK